MVDLPDLVNLRFADDILLFPTCAQDAGNLLDSGVV